MGAMPERRGSAPARRDFSRAAAARLHRYGMDGRVALRLPDHDDLAEALAAASGVHAASRS